MFFDGSTVEDDTQDKQQKILKEGDYSAAISHAYMSENKKQTGSYVAVKFVASGAEIFHFFNIKNDNPKAESIGKREFKNLLLATLGTDKMQTENDLSKLLGRSVTLSLGVRESNYNGKLENHVKRISSATSQLKAEIAAAPNRAVDSMDDIPF